MEYKLYKSKHNSINYIKQILYNRGIEDVELYLNLNSSVEHDYKLLDNIDKAVEVFEKHYCKHDCIGIIPDPDVDGICSSAELYLYINSMKSDYPIKILYHTETKVHGLRDITVPDEVKLLIVADAGTNDVNECKAIYERGIDIIILDHHEMDVENNPYAVIVNNQCSKNYPNKQLCGTGIVYKFLQALDDYYWNEYADNYLDLVALANISDVMDMRSFETRYLVDKGIANIKNNMFKQLIEAQDFSIQGNVTIHNIQWYITPLINALIRIGSNEEKELLFKAFIEQNESFTYKKRATKDHPSEIIEENIYEHVARLCKNIKSKQDRIKEKNVNEISQMVICNPDNKTNKVIVIDATENLDQGLTGVVAMKIADLFQKPCVLLKRYYDSEYNRYIYSGSARNINHSPIESLKDVISETGSFMLAQGHNNAFGVKLSVDKKDEAIDKLNSILKDINYDHVYYVDFCLDNRLYEDRLEILSIILASNNMKMLIGQGIDEPMVAVKNIILHKNDVSVFGKNEDTISFEIDNIKYIMFKCKLNSPLY